MQLDLDTALELLRILDAFLPRINFGKPVLSSKETYSIPGTTDPMGFSYVKRDLVRLLGVLCYKDRKTQDSIRNCGGITVILNMCVVDERNPCALLSFRCGSFRNNANRQICANMLYLRSTTSLKITRKIKMW